MDDLYEEPSFAVPKATEDATADVEESSDEDDGGPDWTKLVALAPGSTSSARVVIPKRGDKEFEPVGGLDNGGRKGTSLQQHKLDLARNAMFSSLDVGRTVSSKNVSYAVWSPQDSRARVLLARGNFLATMGHNVPQNSTLASDGPEVQRKLEKVVELLPEEALYLIERGSMLCWSRHDYEIPEEGTPMSLQQAYAEIIGKQDLTLERYQVYTYLKRLGYTVTRSHPPDPHYVAAPIRSPEHLGNSRPGVLARIRDILLSPFRMLFASSLSDMDWWRPLKSGTAHRFLSYSSILSMLRFIPSGYSHPQLPVSGPPGHPSPYEFFFHVYKPATPYRKTAPSPPDYSIIVVDARNTPIPTFHELCDLFGQLPELPPPVPRKGAARAARSNSSTKKVTEPQNRNIGMASSIYVRLCGFFRWLLRLNVGTTENGKYSVGPVRRPNPFQMLRLGKKMVVVAAVDAGMISFFRFCQGSFNEWPMI